MKIVIGPGFYIIVALLLLPALAAGAQGDADSYFPSISADGRYVAFQSVATNLVAGDTNGASDIFIRDRQTGTTWLVSKNSAGVQGIDGSYNPFISGDGRYAVFASLATNLVTGDTNGVSDIFVRDRASGMTWLVSKSTAGVQGDSISEYPSISTDGRYVAFASSATNLVPDDTNNVRDIFVRDRASGVTWRVSKSSAGTEGNGNIYNPFISADGRYAVFASLATNLVPGDTNGVSDIFVRDRQAGTTWLVSKNSAGVIGDGESFQPVVSADGRYVAFASVATNFDSGETSGDTHIFVRDRASGVTWLVSKSSAGVIGDDESYQPVVSADGRYVAFESDATNLVSGDINGMKDIFVRDRASGATWLVSKNSAGAEGDGDSSHPSISADGRYVTFQSAATNLVSGDTNGAQDIFVRDRASGMTWLVSKS